MLVGFALVERANADEQERDALARQLDASAIRRLEEDPELSLPLASTSARLSPTETAEDALRRSLLTSNGRDVYRTGGPITELEFAPDGSRYAFTSDDGQARVLDAATGEESFARNVGQAGGVSFGSLLVHGSSGPPRILDEATGEAICRIGSKQVADAVLVGDFAVLARNGMGYVWNTKRCKLVRPLGRVGETSVSVVASPNGRRAAFVSGTEARIVDVPSGRVRYRLKHPGKQPGRLRGRSRASSSAPTGDAS